MVGQLKLECQRFVLSVSAGGFYSAIRPGRCPEIPDILKFVLKLDLGPEICTYILKFSRVFTISLKTRIILLMSK